MRAYWYTLVKGKYYIRKVTLITFDSFRNSLLNSEFDRLLLDKVLVSLESVLKRINYIASWYKPQIIQLIVYVLYHATFERVKKSFASRSCLRGFITVLALNRALFPATRGVEKKKWTDSLCCRVDGTSRVSFPYWSIRCRLVSFTYR